jgi:hypothetical protein
MATATSILSMSQQLSRGFGIALSAAVLHWSLAARGATALGTVDFMVAFVSLAFVALAGLPFGWILRHDAAAAVSGHRANVRDRIA